MSAKTLAPTTHEHEGRLAFRGEEAPLSAARFSVLCDAWRPAGYFLATWNRHGQVTAQDAEAGPFWRQLLSAPGYLAAMKEHVHRQISRYDEAGPVANAIDSTKGVDEAGGPGDPDVLTLAFAIRRRNRVVGVLMAQCVSSDLSGETFARFCDRMKLDREAMARLGGSAPRLTGETAQRDRAPLGAGVRLAREQDVSGQEIAVLTHNLESTYEELHLIYSISALMGLPQKPCLLLDKVGREVVEVARASTVAFVLAEDELEATPNTGAGATPRPIEERVVRVGECEMSLQQLDQFAERLAQEPGVATSHVVVNDVSSRPDLMRVSRAARHLMALPMWHNERLLGLMMAINCTDEGDFTSVDVQLLRAVADRVSAFLQNQKLYDDLADLLLGLMHAIVNSVDAKDPYTLGHSERVAYMSRALAQKIGLDATACERVYLSGLLHDVGKIGVPDAILCKPGKLTVEEFDVLKKHPEIGVRILSPVRQTRDLLPGVLYHHERMDGKGYPEGLAGEEIPLLGRIICLADCFDAMTTNRTYRPAMPLPEAIEELRRCSGTQFDSELVEAFLSLDPIGLAEEARNCSAPDFAIGQIGALATSIGSVEISKEAAR